MKNAIVLHGTLGSPKGNWFVWLKGQLENKGLEVWLPQLPHPEQPSLQECADFVHAQCPFAINGGTLLVGHSGGAMLALILAQQNSQPVDGIVAVSVFHENSDDWEPNRRLFGVAFDWPAIRGGARGLFFIHSDNDPCVPLGQAQYVADNCKAGLQVVPGQGHFSLGGGPSCGEFPGLLKILEQGGFLEKSNA